MTAKKKPTAAQLAARERFAEMARSGMFKKKRAVKKNPATRAYTGKYPKRIRSVSSAGKGIAHVTLNDGTRLTVTAQETDGVMPKVGHEIRDFTNPRMTQSLMQMPARFLKTKFEKNPAKRRGPSKVNAPSQATGKRPTKRLQARRVKNTRAGMYPNPEPRHPYTVSAELKPLKRDRKKVYWHVCRMNENNVPLGTIAVFTDKTKAVEYGNAYVKAHKVSVGVTSSMSANKL